MRDNQTAANEYTIMWLYVFFDLPVETRLQRREAALFRKNLLKDGFSMMQYSVYIRSCASFEATTVHVARIRRFVPPEGMISILRITDKQFGDTVTLVGRQTKPPPQNIVQLELF